MLSAVLHAVARKMHTRDRNRETLGVIHTTRVCSVWNSRLCSSFSA